MDLSKVIHLSSNDVTNALLGFFSVQGVLAVLSVIVGWALLALFFRALFSVVRGEDPWFVRFLGLGGESEPSFEVIDERNNPDWVSMPGDLLGLTMEYEKATGYGFSWWPSTLGEQTESGFLADGDRGMVERAGLDEFGWGEDDPNSYT